MGNVAKILLGYKVGVKAIISPLANPDKEYEGTVSGYQYGCAGKRRKSGACGNNLTQVDESLLPNFNINIR